MWEHNCTLGGMQLAMPTLGGSNGQTIAGAISTGTHGTDVKDRPIADAVAAIHRVGPAAGSGGSSGARRPGRSRSGAHGTGEGARAVRGTQERLKLRDPTDPFQGARWVEIFLNPDPTGPASTPAS